MNPPSPLLVAEGVTKTYVTEGAEVPALRGVDLELAPGEIVGLTGPSGCGKSTLLHLVGAMDRPSSGRITLDGVRLDELPEEMLAIERRRRLGFVFQFFNLLPTLTVLENVALPLLLDGVDRAATEDRARTLLDRVGLTHRARHAPSALSGGEMQRAAVARALVGRPRLLLADEPTGSLDSENGGRVLDLIGEVRRELGVSVLLATHSEEVAARADRRIRMRDGRVEDDVPR